MEIQVRMKCTQCINGYYPCENWESWGLAFESYKAVNGLIESPSVMDSYEQGNPPPKCCGGDEACGECGGKSYIIKWMPLSEALRLAQEPVEA